MDFKPILTAALMIGGMGLIFGALLAIIGRIFRVEEDPRKAAVRECLPGANCGGCGLPGCDALANAIVSEQAAVNACPVGGAECAAAIAGTLASWLRSGSKNNIVSQIGREIVTEAS